MSQPLALRDDDHGPAAELDEAGRAALFREHDRLDPQGVAHTRLVRRHPSLLAQQMAVHAAFERDLAAEVGRRIDDPVRA